MHPTVTIVDYGRSNLLSVQRALQEFGFSALERESFALKAGLQAGVRVGESEIAKKVELGIPVGASYEHKGMVLEVRYAIGTGMVPTEGGSADRGRNMVLSFTVGYRIPLGHYKKVSSAAE